MVINEKLEKVYDNYVDELNEILNTKGQKAVNEHIYKLQGIYFDLWTHGLITSEEYQYMYSKFKACLG